MQNKKWLEHTSVKQQLTNSMDNKSTFCRQIESITGHYPYQTTTRQTKVFSSGHNFRRTFYCFSKTKFPLGNSFSLIPPVLAPARYYTASEKKSRDRRLFNCYLSAATYIQQGKQKRARPAFHLSSPASTPRLILLRKPLLPPAPLVTFPGAGPAGRPRAGKCNKSSSYGAGRRRWGARASCKCTTMALFPPP